MIWTGHDLKGLQVRSDTLRATKRKRQISSRIDRIWFSYRRRLLVYPHYILLLKQYWMKAVRKNREMVYRESTLFRSSKRRVD